MHILVITPHFHPEYNAGAIRTFQHCRRWVKNGANVTVVTMVPSFPVGRPFPPYQNKLFQRECIDGVNVIRIWSFLASNRGVVRRSLSFLSFAMTSFLAGMFCAADVIVATSPQLLSGLSGRMVAGLRRKPWVFEVRDLWPDTIMAVKAMPPNAMVRALGALERHLYRNAAHIVTVSEGLKQVIAQRCGRVDKITIIPNGADMDLFRPQTGRMPEAGADFTVGYVGALGFSQGLDVVLTTALRLADEAIAFSFTGAGGNRTGLMAQAAQMGLHNVRFHPPVPPAQAAEHVARCDVMLVPLKDHPLFRSAIPSKIFAAAAMQKPIIAIAGGETAALIDRFDAGLVVPPGDSAALADAILRVRNDDALRKRAAAGGQQLANAFRREQFADTMLELLERVRREHGTRPA